MHLHIGNGVDEIALFTEQLNTVAINAQENLLHTGPALQKGGTELPSEDAGPLQLSESHNILAHRGGRRLWRSLVQLTKRLQTGGEKNSGFAAHYYEGKGEHQSD